MDSPLQDFEPDSNFQFADGDTPQSSELPARPETDLPSVTDGEADHFDPRVNEDVQGLMFLGALTSSFDFAGHSFTIRTIKTGEEIAAAQIVREFADNGLALDKAFGSAYVAACIVTVDGRPLVEALGPGEAETLTRIRRAFAYILANWYYPTVEVVYSEYADLLIRQSRALAALQGK